jgi:hypothetical protein
LTLHLNHLDIHPHPIPFICVLIHRYKYKCAVFILAILPNSRCHLQQPGKFYLKGGKSPTKVPPINHIKHSILDSLEMGQGQSTPGGGNKEKKVCDQRRSLDDCR